MTPEKLLHEGTIRPRRVDLLWDGLTIAGQRLVVKPDASGNLDPHIERQDGTEMNLTGEVLFVRSTSDLTLTTSDQSITATGGDSGNLRILLPTIGEWAVLTTCDFNVTTGGAATAAGILYVNDSGTPETGVARQAMATVDRATVFQQWKITTTAADTPIEIKAKKTADVGVAKAMSGSTTLMATIGAGGGSTVEAVDHGTLTGRGDDDHSQYVLKTLFDAQTVLSATTDNTPAALSVAEQRLVGRLTGGNVAAIAIGIADDNIVQIDDADAADNDYAKLTANGIEGRSYAEVKSDLDLEIGTDVLAQQTIGIADDNLVEMDDAGPAASGEYARFTVNGLEGMTTAQVLADLSGDAGAAFSWNSQNLTSVGTIGCGTITSTGNLIIADAGYIGSASDTDAIQIEADGDIVMSQDLRVSGRAAINRDPSVLYRLAIQSEATPTAGEILFHMGGTSTPQNDDVDLQLFKGEPVIYLTTADQANSQCVGVSSELNVVNNSGVARNFGAYIGVLAASNFNQSGAGYINVSSELVGIRVRSPVLPGGTAVYGLAVYGIDIGDQRLSTSNSYGITTYYGLRIQETTEMRNTGGSVAYGAHITAPSGSGANTSNYGIVQAGTGDASRVAINQFQAKTAFGALISPAATVDITQAGATAAIPVLELDQDDTSEPFINFVGNSSADANSSISSLNTSGATTDHIQIDLNGVKAWIAVSTNAPT